MTIFISLFILGSSPLFAFHQLCRSMEHHEWVSINPSPYRLVFVLSYMIQVRSSYSQREPSMTGIQISNSGSHGCEPSALPLSYPTIPVCGYSNNLDTMQQISVYVRIIKNQLPVCSTEFLLCDSRPYHCDTKPTISGLPDMSLELVEPITVGFRDWAEKSTGMEGLHNVRSNSVVIWWLWTVCRQFSVYHYLTYTDKVYTYKPHRCW